MIKPVWRDQTVAVIGGGPSLTQADVEMCRHLPVIAVNDAYRLAPWADVLYGADADWWACHALKLTHFAGQKWSCLPSNRDQQEKIRAVAPRVGLKLIDVKTVDAAGNYVTGFSTDPAFIHSGGHSGYQAVNLAYHFGAREVLLLGFDHRPVEGKTHWFGSHPGNLNQPSPYRAWVEAWNAAAAAEIGLSILNCTPGSAITALPQMLLLDALRVAEVRKYERIYALDPNYRMGASRKEEAQKRLRAMPRRGSLLDVGCGRGEVLAMARNLGFEPVHGVEANRLLLSDTVSYGAIWDLPFAARSFDYVTCLDVLEHLLPCDTEIALREIKRVARHGVLLSVNNKPSHRNMLNVEMHINKRPYAEWAELIGAQIGGSVQRHGGPVSESFVALL